MIDFSKAFPERTAANLDRLRRQSAALIARDPFGGATLEKAVHHRFSDGDRVRVNLPGHHTHGHAGVVTDDRNDSRICVRLDSGHSIGAPEWELIPEDFPVAAASESVSDKIAKRNPMAIEDDELAKNAGSKFRIGQAVVEKGDTRRAGTVVGISPSGLLEIRFSPSLSGLYASGSLEAA